MNISTKGLEKSVRESIIRLHLFKKGEAIVVGVSGGPDSVALAHILHKLRGELGIRLVIAHFNHKLRRTSDRDEHFVQQLANRLNVPFYSKSWKSSQLKNKGSLEERARTHRFHFLVQLAKKEGAQSIVLAHTMDDLAETVLMRILRGSGLKGLQAILPKRKLYGVHFVRPLLEVRKKEVIEFLKKNKIKYCVDATNKDTYYLRNRVRLKLLPLLSKEYNSNIIEILANTSNNAAMDYEFLDQCASKVLKKTVAAQSKSSVKIDRKKFDSQNQAIRRLILRKALEQIQGSTRRLTHKHMKDVERFVTTHSNNVSCNLPNKVRLNLSNTYITISLN